MRDMESYLKITFILPSLGQGGAERVASNLLNSLANRGYETSVILVSRRIVSYHLDERVRVECLDCDDDNALPFLKRFRIRLNKIKGAVNKLSSDVVISFMSETNIDVCFALFNSKIPIIVSERNDPAIDPASRVKQFLRKIAYLKPKGFVFQTPDAQNYFSKRIRKKSKIILNPLIDNLPKLNIDKEKRIVAVGRLHKQKNFPLLIEAFEIFSRVHPEYVLEIYGEGALKEELVQIIKEKGLQDKVFLKGFCKDVHQKIVSAEMFVMTSGYEGMPNALLEAMALGLTCISTDCPCGGPRMLIKNNENGLLVPLKDVNALKEAMNYVAENPLEAKEMAKNAVQIREMADGDKIVDNWLQMVNDCLGVK